MAKKISAKIGRVSADTDTRKKTRISADNIGRPIYRSIPSLNSCYLTLAYPAPLLKVSETGGVCVWGGVTWVEQLGVLEGDGCDPGLRAFHWAVVSSPGAVSERTLTQPLESLHTTRMSLLRSGGGDRPVRTSSITHMNTETLSPPPTLWRAVVVTINYYWQK